jgi:hypothetical protein
MAHGYSPEEILMADAFDIQALIDKFGTALAVSVVPYLPAIKRFTMAEALAFWDLLNQKKQDAAMQAVHDKMTAEELADEKVKLADLTAAMADNNAEKRQFARDVAMAVLKVALAIGLGMVGL